MVDLDANNAENTSLEFDTSDKQIVRTDGDV